MRPASTSRPPRLDRPPRRRWVRVTCSFGCRSGSEVRRMTRYSRALILGCASLAAAAGPVDPALVAGLRWRSVGPAMFAGRVDDVAGIPGNPNILYAAHSTGGL